MENNILTAEEFMQQGFSKPPYIDVMNLQFKGKKVHELIIEFAKLHLQAQQEAILKVLENRGEHNNIDKNIIINSYPLNLIK